jgi:hypothetical protein
MKKNKIAGTTLSFVFGAIIGVSLFALFSFTRTTAPAEPQSSVTVITAADAHALLNRYLMTAPASTTPIKGFYLDLQQLDAMNRLVKENPALAGFRLYLGKAVNDIPVGIVVGVDNKGSDATTNSIYKTDSQKSGPCPTICDQNSPITKN